MPPALPVIRITAAQRNAGKTTLAVALLESFRERGYQVAAVKRSHHAMQADVPGKDTALLAGGGADPVIFVAPDGTLERRFESSEPLNSVVQRLAGTVDLVIAEGFKGETLGAEVRLGGEPPARFTLTSMDGRELLRGSANDVERIVSALEQEFCMCAAGDTLLNESIRRASALHGHYCPGIILGVRMSMAAAASLGLSLPDQHRRLSVTVERAKCFADAVAATAGCSIGRRNLVVNETGETAAIFEDRESGRSIRVSILDSSREAARRWAPEAASSRHAQSVAYRLMPDEELLTISTES